MRSLIFHVDVNSAFLSWESAKRLRDNPDALDLRTINAVIGGDGLECGEIPFEHGLIERDLQAGVGRHVDGDEQIQLAAVHVCLDEGLDRVLSKAVDARELDVQIQIAVVDRPHLDGDLPAVDGFFRAAVAGHTSDHVAFLPFYSSAVAGARLAAMEYWPMAPAES